MIEAEIIHDLPDDLAAFIGRIIVICSNIEHKLNHMSGMVLGLNKQELRIGIRSPRMTDALDMFLDLMALKQLYPRSADELGKKLNELNKKRDSLAHGIFLREKGKTQIYLTLSTGTWPKNLTNGETVSRRVVPQHIPFHKDYCESVLALGNEVLLLADEIGLEIDQMISAHPDRFRHPAPILDPTAIRKNRGK